MVRMSSSVLAREHHASTPRSADRAPRVVHVIGGPVDLQRRKTSNHRTAPTSCTIAASMRGLLHSPR